MMTSALNQNINASYYERGQSLHHERPVKAINQHEIQDNGKDQNSLKTDIEKTVIKRILNVTDGDTFKTASLLNMNHMSLVRKIQEYDISLTQGEHISVYA